jgi:hypothetical protein
LPPFEDVNKGMEEKNPLKHVWALIFGYVELYRKLKSSRLLQKILIGTLV